MNYRFPLALAMAATLSACASGGSTVGGPNPGSPGAPTPTPVPTSTSGGSSSNRASATMTFLAPRIDTQASAKAGTRKPDFISPGLDKMTFIVDGTKLLSAVELSTLTNSSGGSAGTFTSTDGNTSVSFTVTATGNYYTYVATIAALPGNHTFGVEILGGSPAIILSEAQQSVDLMPYVQNNFTITLMGVLATYYIECASGPVDPNTGCSSSFTAGSGNGSGGSYTLTAIGADFDGFPIANQNALAFDNGPFTVVETDGNGILTLSTTSYNSPGTALTNAPSGGFYVNATSTYGQQFTATCNKSGNATIALQIAATGPNTPLTGETYTTFDPSNNFPTSGNYPGAGTLAAGSKYPGNTAYHNGSNPNAVTTLSTVNCTANGSITIN